MSGVDLIARREALGHTLADVADLSGVAKGSIWAVEHDKKPRGGAKEKYLAWLCAAEERAANGMNESMPWLKFNPKLYEAAAVEGEEHVFVSERRNKRYEIVPTSGPCEGWKPGHRFRVKGEGGSFVFQRVEENLSTGLRSVMCHGGTARNHSFRAFKESFIIVG